MDGLRKWQKIFCGLVYFNFKTLCGRTLLSQLKMIIRFVWRRNAFHSLFHFRIQLITWIEYVISLTPQATLTIQSINSTDLTWALNWKPSNLAMVNTLYHYYTISSGKFKASLDPNPVTKDSCGLCLQDRFIFRREK